MIVWKEASHRTNDEEFYIPRVLQIKSKKDLLNEARGYIYYYNNVREHSSLDDQIFYQYLKMQLPEIDDNIRYVQPIILDDVSVKLGPWSGYNVLAHHLCRQSGRAMNDHHRVVGRPQGAPLHQKWDSAL